MTELGERKAVSIHIFGVLEVLPGMVVPAGTPLNKSGEVVLVERVLLELRSWIGVALRVLAWQWCLVCRKQDRRVHVHLTQYILPVRGYSNEWRTFK